MHTERVLAGAILVVTAFAIGCGDAAIVRPVALLPSPPSRPDTGARTPSPAARPPGLLAFAAWDGRGEMIFTMFPDGSGLTALTTGGDPRWNPDGTAIAFTRWGPHEPAVYVRDVGTGAERLVATGGHQPAWSPDGTRIAFACGGICVIGADGSNRAALTGEQPSAYATAAGCIRDSSPAWSPDGSVIAFTHWPDADGCASTMAALLFPFDFWTEIRFIAPDGSGERPLRDSAGRVITYAAWPSWSPDGSRLAFYHAAALAEDISLIDPDGANWRVVARKAPSNFVPALGGPDWSPDGQLVVFGAGAEWGVASVNDGAVVRPPMILPSGLIVWSWSRTPVP